MADKRKPTNSSMFDLKAELYRKQEEYKQLKAQKTSDFVKAVRTSKPGKGDKIWSKQNAGVSQRASRDLAQQQEEDDVMQRSKMALEAKSKIYDKISSASGIPEEDGSEGYLVDFERKAVDRLVRGRREQDTPTRPAAAAARQDDPGHGSEEDTPRDGPEPLPANAEEEWVDYVDTFGRSRCCMKKDLPHMEKQDWPLGSRAASESGLRLKEGASLMSGDMKRELRRQQWEREAEESAHGPVHYANVQFDEIRTHGTGFYQFSKDSNLREEQMETLNKLREQTVDSRQRSERIKEKRKVALEARLAKVKQRRKKKDGAGLLGSQDKDTDEDKKLEEEQKTETVTPKDAEPLSRDDSWRRNAPVREWDIGKEKLPEWNARRYMEQRRTERESEFAPPQIYFDHKPSRAAAAEAKAFKAHTAPATHRPPSADTGLQSGYKQQQTSQSSLSNTNIMLKQIRQSVETSHSEDSSKVNLTSIPMPEMGQKSAGEASERVQSSLSNVGEAQRKWEDGVDSQHVQWSNSGFVHLPPAGHPVFGGHVPDMSVPPPVPDTSLPPPSYLPHPQVTDMVPPPPALAGAFTTPPPAAGQQGWSSGTPFAYPSQQGLLKPQPTPSLPSINTTTTQATNQHQPLQYIKTPQPSQFKKLQQPSSERENFKKSAAAAVAVAQPSAAAKLNMVDKRFMQNREVSEDDLLGYMAQLSADALANVQAVAYTPGHFSSAPVSQTSGQHDTQHTEAESLAQAEVNTTTTTTTTKQAAQTEGVIFGVPKFLQPAAMKATSYQPGSFMAAKEAAAQRAEEEIEAAKKKTQYFSAPVLYGCTTDEDELWGTEGGESSTGKGMKDDVPQQCEDQEFAKFLKEVKGVK